MNLIAVSQRVDVDSQFGERRDCLDQAWIKFMMACGLTPIPVPNEAEAARSLCSGVPVDGILLTGGNDLSSYGGDAPERDATENALMDIAEDRALPLLGVCRGMQMIQHRFGIRLKRVAGHIAAPPGHLDRRPTSGSEQLSQFCCNGDAAATRGLGIR